MHTMSRQLRYILSAAREGSISAAAEAEAISASSILAAIDKFESYYETQIFVRKRSKGLSVTVNGQTILMRMRRLLDEMDSFEDELKQASPTVSGELRVGVFLTIAAHLMPHIMRSLYDDYPDLSIRHNEGNVHQVESDLRTGKVDVALTYDLNIPDDMNMFPILHTPSHAVLPADDPLTSHDIVTIDDLAERRLIVLDSPDAIHHMTSMFSHAGHRPKILHRVRSYELIRSTVAMGIGVTIMNLRPVMDMTYAGKEVVCRPLRAPDEKLRIRIGVVTRRDDIIGPKVRAFISHCQRFAKSEVARNLTVKATELHNIS